MMNADSPQVPTEPTSPVALLWDLHQAMDERLNQNVNHAFNLGCLLSMAPGAILVLLTFLISKGNISATLLAILIAAMLMLAAANLLAYLSRRATAQVFYQQHAAPRIQSALAVYHTSLHELYHLACQELPDNAPLVQLLSRELASDDTFKNEG